MHRCFSSRASHFLTLSSPTSIPSAASFTHSHRVTTWEASPLPHPFPSLLYVRQMFHTEAFPRWYLLMIPAILEALSPPETKHSPTSRLEAPSSLLPSPITLQSHRKKRTILVVPPSTGRPILSADIHSNFPQYCPEHLSSKFIKKNPATG